MAFAELLRCWRLRSQANETRERRKIVETQYINRHGDNILILCFYFTIIRRVISLKGSQFDELIHFKWHLLWLRCFHFVTENIFLFDIALDIPSRKSIINLKSIWNLVFNILGYLWMMNLFKISVDHNRMSTAGVRWDRTDFNGSRFDHKDFKINCVFWFCGVTAISFKYLTFEKPPNSFSPIKPKLIKTFISVVS